MFLPLQGIEPRPSSQPLCLLSYSGSSITSCSAVKSNAALIVTGFIVVPFLAYYVTLKMKATYYTETSVDL
jgi:hypothetical protein